MHGRDFLLAVIFVAVAVTAPTSGQANEQPSSGAQGAASIPDFSGVWGHPYLPGFEPPQSGRGPVLNKSRVRQIFGPDGPIAPGTNSPLVSSNYQLVGDYANPILNPQAAEVVRKRGEIELNGVAAPTPTNQCWPEPVPYIFWNIGIQILQERGRVTIIYGQDNQVRHVRLNQPHPTQVVPSWYGDSVGHYEGETLVVDTVGIRTDRPLAMVDWFGTPYTELLHVVERYQLIDFRAALEAQERAGNDLFRIPGAPGANYSPDPDYKGKALQLQFTVEDEGVFTMPWSAAITYRRPLNTEWGEYLCSENTRGPGSWISLVPHAEKPDF
jgi:hypothetical protein